DGNLHAPSAVRDRHAGDGRHGPRGEGGAGRCDPPPSAGGASGLRSCAPADDATVRGHGGHHVSGHRAPARDGPRARAPARGGHGAARVHAAPVARRGGESREPCERDRRRTAALHALRWRALAARRGPARRLPSALSRGGGGLSRFPLAAGCASYSASISPRGLRVLGRFDSVARMSATLSALAWTTETLAVAGSSVRLRTAGRGGPPRVFALPP